MYSISLFLMTFRSLAEPRVLFSGEIAELFKRREVSFFERLAFQLGTLFFPGGGKKAEAEEEKSRVLCTFARCATLHCKK